jgi:hypothetical protein
MEIPDRPVPAQVERAGVVWNLVDRGDRRWGIQQGLAHQGVLEFVAAEEATSWRVVTTDIAYAAPDAGFSSWSEAVDDFLIVAGDDAIDSEA